MVETRSIEDPLGNVVLVSAEFSDSYKTFFNLKQVIQTPAFIIEEGEGSIYYFKLTTKNTNLLVKTKRNENNLTIEDFQLNPPLDFISKLLQRGKIIFWG